MSDTAPEAEEYLFELLRQKTPSQRVSMMRSLTTIAARNSRRAIANAYPEMSADERELYFIELTHGIDVANMVREQRTNAGS